MRAALLTAVALVGFAANSVLNRWALADGTIDPGSFATLRLGSGALALALLLAVRRSGGGAEASNPETGGPQTSDREAGEREAGDRETGRGGEPAAGRRGSWRGAVALLLYAVPFSFAYLALSAGTGALLLFGAVQVTMIGVGLWQGERPHALEWAGLAAALAGLVYLVAPGLSAPPLAASLLMATAGVAWGVYSLLGRGSRDPLAVTAGNFLRAAPLALATVAAAALLAGARPEVTPAGAVLALVSGALTSGVAYAVWYAALAHLTATTAATVQLSVPILAALGGVAVLGETVDVRLVVASVLVLGGVAVAIRGRQVARRAQKLRH